MSADGTYLGFDAGEKRLGVAVGQTVTGQARALTVVACRAGVPDWASIDALIDEWRPVGLVVGMPRHADGSASHSTRVAERLAGELGRRSGMSVHRIDEHLSSRAAAESLRERGATADVLDAEAARIILETWFAEQLT
jgi:putative Holliday junction resolvase